MIVAWKVQSWKKASNPDLCDASAMLVAMHIIIHWKFASMHREFANPDWQIICKKLSSRIPVYEKAAVWSLRNWEISITKLLSYNRKNEIFIIFFPDNCSTTDFFSLSSAIFKAFSEFSNFCETCVYTNELLTPAKLIKVVVELWLS